MKAFILAAGKGTRLQPITTKTPKALIAVNGIPLLERVIRQLILNGATEVIINIHHHADQIKKFIEEKNGFNIPVSFSDETEELLDTGGAIKNIEKYFDKNEDFIVHNVDILTNLNLRALFFQHQKSGALATLAIRDRKSSKKLLFNERLELRGWKDIRNKNTIDKSADHENLKAYAFSGIHIINSNIFEHFEKEQKFSIIDAYLNLCNSHKISGSISNDTYWFDTGTNEKLSRAEKFFKLAGNNSGTH